MVLYSGLAIADRWVPYTDGRVGGCFINNNGYMFGCTPQPPPPTPPPAHRADPIVVEVPVQDPAQEEAIRRAQSENDRLRNELSEQRRLNDERDQAAADAETWRKLDRAAADQDAWLRTPDGKKYAAEVEEQRRREKAQELQIQVNSQGKNSLKECYKQKKTPICDQDGCRCN